MGNFYQFTDAGSALPVLMDRVLHGDTTPSRNGTTRELRFAQIELTEHYKRRGINTPGRKASLPAQIAETMWVLAGRNDVGWLANYLPRAPEFSDDGTTWRGGYGPRIRSWNEGRVDQFRHVIELLKRDPDTRRAIINIYDPSVDSAGGKDVPCNNWLHFIARDGVLDLHVATRSNDLMWGWSGINAFEWSVLLEVVAFYAGMDIGSVVFSISSLHLYEPYFKKAQRIVDEGRGTQYPATMLADRAFDPRAIKWAEDPIDNFDLIVDRWFEIEELIRTGGEKIKESIDSFPEPMMKSWLHVLHAYWSGDSGGQVLNNVGPTSMYYGFLESPKRKDPAPAKVATDSDAFSASVVRLHREKHAAYGNSWKKRGELVSILANIARKVDRLEGGKETADESQVDTAIDLWVYLLKYHAWLSGKDTDRTTSVDIQIAGFQKADTAGGMDFQGCVDTLIEGASAGHPAEYRTALVAAMAAEAGQLAYARWAKQQWKDGNAARSWKGYGDE